MTLSLSALRRSGTARTVAVFGANNTVAMLLGVVGSLVMARYIGPEDMGVFRTFGIVAGYLTFLHLGVFDGLQREIPLQLGRGDQKKAEEVASACLAWIISISLAGGALFLSLAARAAYCHQWMQFWGWLAFAPAIVGTFYGGYLGTTFRTGQQFISLSRIGVVQAIAGTLVLPLLPVMGYFGACLRTAVISVTNLSVLHRWRPLKIRPRLDWASVRDVVRIGLPLSGIGYLSTSLWASVEGTIVLKWFGLKALGLYSMAVFVRTVVNQLAQNVNQVMNVKIYELYGRSGGVEDCVRLSFKPVAFGFLLSLLLIVGGWFALPLVVPMVIPKYVGAIAMMRVMLLTMSLTMLGLPVAILWATGRLIDCFAGAIAGFMVFAGLAYVLYRLGFGVLSVLVASVSGQAINVLVSYILLLRLVRHERRLRAA